MQKLIPAGGIQVVVKGVQVCPLGQKTMLTSLLTMLGGKLESLRLQGLLGGQLFCVQPFGLRSISKA